MKPLALLVYEKLLPASQLVNQLQDRGYRVQSLTDPASLADHAEREKPLIVIADLEARFDMPEAIGKLRQNTSTGHIPVIAFATPDNTAIQERARAAGAKLVVNDNAILVHLDQFLSQALEVE